MNTKKIAVIGSGISGLTSALLLQDQHNVSLFEQNDYYGGHTHTIDVEHDGKTYPVNTGFIVFNDWTYPNFIKLMSYLDVESEASSMSFSVRCDKTGLEYNGADFNSLFCQRRNIVNPGFWLMIKDILRFNKEATGQHLDGTLSQTQTLGEYLEANGYGHKLKQYYIVPMGAAIWSCPESAMLNFPVSFFVRFFHNHGLLSVNDRPQWRVIQGGSRSYVSKLLEKLTGPKFLERKIIKIRRQSGKILLRDSQGIVEEFDKVVLACHSDQALQLLEQPSPDEQQVLSALPYQDNSVVLHTDTSLLPRRKLGWAAWNYRITNQPDNLVALTYNMNILQNFSSDKTFCVSLNQDQQIDPKKIIERYTYAHPCFSHEGIDAQAKHSLINGVNNTYYCGAYWSNGFHEDGVNSAIAVAKALNINFEEVLRPWKAQFSKAS